MLTERLQNAAEKLPRGLAPKLAPITTGLGEIVFYILDYAPNAPDKPATRREQLMELEIIHDYQVKPLLRTVPGLADVNGSGGYEKQIVVLPNPEKLKAAGLTVSELAEIIGENTQNAGGGVVNQGDSQLIVRSVGRVQTTKEIAELPVKFAAGVRPLLVKDLGGSCELVTKCSNGGGDGKRRRIALGHGPDVERREQSDRRETRR